ncbi:MAG: CoA transferase [Proteobacteria bacterium]|nr:CoA transferase [Pseudomonadota bacterium]
MLDLSRVLAGPWAAMSLGDLGAEVWKIENRTGGDDTRAWSVPDYKGASTYFMCANRGKHSIALDLKAPAALRIVHELAALADIVIENFRPGTADRLGIGYADLSRVNPRLIYCSISGYGQQGPESDRPGYDFIMQAESGLMAITGATDGPPQRLGVAFTDVVAGMTATQSILAALYQRQLTGAGQYLDVTLLESSLNLLINVGSGYLNGGHEPARFGNAHPTVVPYQLFDAQDGSFALAVGNDRMFRDLCHAVIGRPEMADDERFRSAKARALHRDALLAELSALFAANPVEHWLAACRAASVPAGRVKSVGEALASETVAARGTVTRTMHPSLGPIDLIGPAHGIEGQGQRTWKAPPLLGEDTRAVLEQVLGYEPARIAALEAEGAILCGAPAA